MFNERPLLGAQLSAGNLIAENETLNLNFSLEERKILKELAQKVAELASRPEEEEKKKLWFKHNALEGTRPLIFCDPENAWNEIITEKDIRCNNKVARQWEFRLKQEIFRGEKLKDDKVIEPFFDIPYVYSEGGWGLEEKIISPGEGGAYTWEAPLKEYKDLEKLKFPELKIDFETTDKMVELAREIFGDYLEVRIKSMWWFGLTNTLIRLRGHQQIMFDMYDYPEELHRLLNFIFQGMMKKLDYLEENNLLFLNNDGTYVGSGGFGYSTDLPAEDFEGKVRANDIWGFAESQETTGVSPEMFKEFIFPYQNKMLERFGLNCYGCCEPLDQRWDIVKEIPRLRRVSVSPWADAEKMADYLQDKYIFSLKPNPAYLAVERIDDEQIREDLRSLLQVALKRGCHVEVIMKDTHTIKNNPMNVIHWCEIARQEVERLL